MLKYIKAFRDGWSRDLTARAFDEGFRQGEIAAKAAAMPEEEALDQAYSLGARAGYLSALSRGARYNCRVREVDIEAPGTDQLPPSYGSNAWWRSS
jgi:hypothetical protein